MHVHLIAGHEFFHIYIELFFFKNNKLIYFILKYELEITFFNMNRLNIKNCYYKNPTGKKIQEQEKT